MTDDGVTRVRRPKIYGLLVLIALLFATNPVQAVSPFQVNGPHYNLNIIGACKYDETLGKEVGDSMGTRSSWSWMESQRS